MKRIGLLKTVVLMALIAVTMLGGCSNGTGQPAKEPGTTKPNTEQSTAKPKATQETKAGGSRIEQLLSAWTAAGLKTELKEEITSAVINAMYGSSRMYHIFLDEQLVIVLEFDLKNLDSTGSSYLEYVDKNGTDRRSGEPAWRNEEFVLVNEASLLENGEVVGKFKVTEHPASEKILETFKSF